MPVELSIVESVTELETTVVEVILESASAPGPQGPAGASGATTLDGLTDVTLTSTQTGDRLEFDGAEWVNTASAAVGLHGSTHEDGGTDELDVTGLSGVLADAQTPASHVHAGEDITSGTVADARIASTIARDSEVTSAISTSEAGQVRDGDTAGGVLSGTYPNPGFASDMATQAELDAHTGDTADAHDASAISFTPAGSIAATDVQAAIEEVASEAGGGGAPADVDYLVGTASGDLSAEIVVGTSPGGELGGTWASPTVDATHSGSSHASVQAAAEATAAAALSAHTGDTSDAHDASAISVDSTNLSGTATDVQASLGELDDLLDDHSARHENGGADEISIAGLDGTPSALQTHLDDTADAHDASSISNVAAGNIVATDVQAAINELDTEKTTASAALTAAQTEIADQKRAAVIAVSDPNGDAITTGDGKAYFTVPNLLNGHNLVAAAAALTTVSSSGDPLIQIHNLTQTADMLSTRISIDANELHSKDATAAAVIDTGNDDVAYGDLLRVDIDTAGTGAKGLFVILTFEAP